MKKIIVFLLFCFVSSSFAQQSETVVINWDTSTDYDAGLLKLKVPKFDPVHYSIDITAKKILFKKIVWETTELFEMELGPSFQPLVDYTQC